VLAAFAPIWVLTLVGYLAGLTRVLGPGAVDVLGRFVFYVAMPAALIAMLAREPVTGLAGRALAAFAASTALIGGLGFLLARRVFRRPLGDQAIAGMLSGYINAANLGIPIAVQVLGNATFIAVVLLFQVLVVAPMILALLDAGTREAPRGRWRDILTLPVRNPVLVGCLVGVVIGASGWEPPVLALDIVGLLGAAAVPTALVALGLSLAPVPDPALVATPPRRVELALVVALKTLVQPAAAYVLARFAFGLSGAELFAVVICAGLPAAQNTFVFARAYGVDARFARNGVVLSTAVSMATLTLAAVLLG
jgi:predicted permease